MNYSEAKRKEFEAWARRLPAAILHDFSKREDGEYADPKTDLAWMSWKACGQNSESKKVTQTVDVLFPTEEEKRQKYLSKKAWVHECLRLFDCFNDLVSVTSQKEAKYADIALNNLWEWIRSLEQTRFPLEESHQRRSVSVEELAHGMYTRYTRKVPTELSPSWKHLTEEEKKRWIDRATEAVTNGRTTLDHNVSMAMKLAEEGSRE